MVVRSLADGVYCSFLPGSPRRVVFSEAPLAGPHIVQTNGVVRAFDVRPLPATAGAPTAELALASVNSLVARPQPDGAAAAPAGYLTIALELAGHVPLEVEFVGLPKEAPCELEFTRGRARGITSPAGVLRLSLGVEQTGAATLSCRTGSNNG